MFFISKLIIMNSKMRKMVLLCGMALAVVMSGCSSTRVAKVESKQPVPYEKMLEHLKVSKEEQKMVEQITQSNEFQVYVDMYTEYMKLREKMSKEEADKTELGKMRLDLFNSLTSTMDILNFSPNAMAAVWATVSYKRLNKTK